MFAFNLEDTVKCRLTGFTGVIMARTEWNNGCLRYNVQPPIGKDGKLPEAVNFDQEDLLLVKPAKQAPTKRDGGPQRGEPTRFGR